MILTFEKPADIEANIWVSVEDNQYFGLPDSSTGSLFPIGSNITSRQIQKSVLKRNIGRKRVFVGVYAAERVDEITVKASYKGCLIILQTFT